MQERQEHRNLRQTMGNLICFARIEGENGPAYLVFLVLMNILSNHYRDHLQQKHSKQKPQTDSFIYLSLSLLFSLSVR